MKTMKTNLHNLKRAFFAMIMLLGVGVTAWGAETTLLSYTVGETAPTAKTDITAGNGKIQAGNAWTPDGAVSGSYGWKIDGDPTASKATSKYVFLKLASDVTFAQGDVISLTGYSGSNASASSPQGFSLYDGAGGSALTQYAHIVTTSTSKNTLFTESYTIPAGSALIGKTGVFVSRYFPSGDKGVSAYFVGVTITRSNGGDTKESHSVTYAKGDEAVTGVVPTQEDVEEEGTFTVAAGTGLAWEGHSFTGWNDGSNNYAAGDTYTMGTSNVTLTAQWEEVTPGPGPEPECPETGVLYSVAFSATNSYTLNATTTAEAEITSDYATVSNGKAYAGTDKTSDLTVAIKSQSSSIQFNFGSNNAYLKLEMDCPLANGDEISFESTTTYELSFGLNSTPRVTAPATSSKVYTVTEGDGLKGNNTIYVWRAAGSSTYVHSITVRRPAAKHDIHYAETRDADMSAYPTQYEEGVGVASFAPLANVTGWDFAGWSPASISAEATEDVTITATWTAATPVYSGEKQLTRVKFSNGFDAFVKESDHSVKAYYLGETAPEVMADSWTVSEKATAAVVDGKIVVTAEDGTTQDYAITLTKVEPYDTYDEVITLDGSQDWVVGGGYNGDSGKEYYAANKSCDEAPDKMRIAEGKNRINLFVGACSTIDLTVAAQRDLAVYKNGVVVEGLTNSGAKNATFTIPVNEKNPCYITIVNTTGCSAGDLAFYNLTLKAFVTPAATPTFTTDLNTTASFEEGADVTLTVEATATDAGVLSYQWYKNDAVIAEATETSLVVNAEGNYKVVVTNTLSETNKATATSTVCAVTMNEKAGCNYVGTPEDGENWYTSVGNWTLYSADSDGRKNTSNKFGNNKNFDGATVPVLSDQRFLFVPAKDMTEVQVYATTGGSRTLSSVKVTNEVVEASASKPTYVDGGIEVATANVEEVSAHYVFTATGSFEAGKCYWFAFSGTVYSFRICYTEAMPKADDPELNTLANEAACGTFTELKATEGAVSGYSYQWYKDAEAIAEATAYNYQPTEAGVYYCAVTNSQADRRDNTKNTNEATLSLKAATTITAHSSLNARGAVDAVVTLSVTATGEGALTYAWYTCDDEAGANATIIPDAETDSYEATIAAGTQYYKAVVTGECGDAELIFAVSEKVNVELQPVTKTTTWDWEKTTYQSDAKTVTDMVLANIDGVTNDENFESDKIMFTGNWGAREETSTKHYMRATEVKMNFEVGGLLTIYFRGTANEKTATVVINGKQVGYTSGSSTPVASDAVPVYGETTISLSGSGGSVQVYKIVFRAADYTRDLSGKIGTICLPNDVKAGDFAGITFYEPIYLNYVGGTPDKIYFDEITELEAGRGYIFIPETGATKLMAIYSGDAVGSALAATQEHPMQGTLGGIAPAASNELTGNFMIKDNMFWTCGEWCGLRENTAYIKANLIQTSGEMPAPTAGRHRIALQSNESDGANTTTAIDNLTEDGVVATAKKIMLNGVMYIQRGNQMFTLDGQLVK